MSCSPSGPLSPSSVPPQDPSLNIPKVQLGTVEEIQASVARLSLLSQQDAQLSSVEVPFQNLAVPVASSPIHDVETSIEQLSLLEPLAEEFQTLSVDDQGFEKYLKESKETQLLLSDLSISRQNPRSRPYEKTRCEAPGCKAVIPFYLKDEFKCRCKKIFCGKHRVGKHTCSFDFRAHQAVVLMKNSQSKFKDGGNDRPSSDSGTVF